MEVVAGSGVGQFVAERGGRLFVWTDSHRCCSGNITYLQTSTDARDAGPFTPFESSGFVVWFESGVRPPDELHLEVKGLRRKHVEAYWNGCAFKM